MDDDRRAFLRELLTTAVAAVDPLVCVPPALPAPPAGRTVLIAAGKAAAAMAQATEKNWDGPLQGLAVTRYGHAVPCETVAVIEAGHPLPDEAGQDAARRALQLCAELGPDDLLLCLLSGGGSALMVEPAEGLTMANKQGLTAALLRSGATISEINCVRKHLSAIKGGRLAAAAEPAPSVTLMISDVPGDDPATVASGPTLPDPTTQEQARSVLDRYGISPPPVIQDMLNDPARETPKTLKSSQARVISRAADALAAARKRGEAAGLRVTVLGDSLEGEARDVAAAHADIARAHGPGLILSGGELTVTLSARGGAGGPNAEYALALAVALDGAPGIHAIACDTDGIDGSRDNAGAIVGPDTVTRARAAGLDAAEMLDAHDSYGFFEQLGDLVVTGPTRTNVNDFRAILID